MAALLPVTPWRDFPVEYPIQQGAAAAGQLGQLLYRGVNIEREELSFQVNFRPITESTWQSFCKYTEEDHLSFLFNVRDICSLFESILFKREWRDFFSFIKEQCLNAVAVSSLYFWPSSIDDLSHDPNRDMHYLREHNTILVALRAFANLISSMGYLANFVGRAVVYGGIDVYRLASSLPLSKYLFVFLDLLKKVAISLGLPINFIDLTLLIGDAAYSAFEFFDALNDANEWKRFLRSSGWVGGFRDRDIKAVEVEGEVGLNRLQISSLSYNDPQGNPHRIIRYYTINKDELKKCFEEQATHYQLEFICKIYDCALCLLALIGIASIYLAAIGVTLTLIDQIHYNWFVTYELIPKEEQKTLLYLNPIIPPPAAPQAG